MATERSPEGDRAAPYVQTALTWFANRLRLTGVAKYGRNEEFSYFEHGARTSVGSASLASFYDLSEQWGIAADVNFDRFQGQGIQRSFVTGMVWRVNRRMLFDVGIGGGQGIIGNSATFYRRHNHLFLIDMMQLYYYPSNASMAPHILLEELGVRYERILVDRTRNAHKTPEYLKLNPNGLIPVLIDEDLVLYETAAICLHLCDRFPSAGLAPAQGTQARAKVLPMADLGDQYAAGESDPVLLSRAICVRWRSVLCGPGSRQALNRELVACSINWKRSFRPTASSGFWAISIRPLIRI